MQVFSLANVDWQLANFGIKTINEIIRQQLTPEEQNLFQKQAATVESLFLNANPKSNQVDLLKQQLQHSRNSISFTFKP